MTADLPIIFSAPMVRAILREIEQPGTGKTQTRRLFKPRGFEFYTDPVSGDRYNQYRPYRDGTWDESRIVGSGTMEQFDWGEHLYAYLPIAPGDRLYVREAWHTARSLDGAPPRDIPRDADIEHAATARNYAEIGLKGKMRPAMFLPRWASRITLTVTDVRVQRLQEISEADAKAEGMWSYQTTECDSDPRLDGNAYRETYWHWRRDIEEGDGYSTAKSAFQHLWDSLNVDRGHGWDTNPWVAAYTFRPILGNIDEVAR